jgi:hypothetical protein
MLGFVTSTQPTRDKNSNIPKLSPETLEAILILLKQLSQVGKNLCRAALAGAKNINQQQRNQ